MDRRGETAILFELSKLPFGFHIYDLVLLVARFAVSMDHMTRKFLKTQFPNDESTRRAALAFYKHTEFMLNQFDEMTGGKKAG